MSLDCQVFAKESMLLKMARALVASLTQSVSNSVGVIWNPLAIPRMISYKEPVQKSTAMANSLLTTGELIESKIAM